jgi:hypothetical protein
VRRLRGPSRCGYDRRTPHRGETQFVRAWILLDLVPLHRLHAAMRLLGSAVPPMLAGMMWSTVSASAPQYAQVCASRSSMANRNVFQSAVFRSGLFLAGIRQLPSSRIVLLVW